ncbi:MAG: glycosyltransferase family 2 protein [Bacteroidales bacterium]|nr:glycosyltransferase family 2 protein [Bacteroidales bacterium]
MSLPKVIVLILNFNGKHLLEEAITSYMANDYQNFEVVVIDNGSTDGTNAWVEQTFPGIFVLRTEKNLGYSGGFNFGLDYAFNQKHADYVLISNNDVKADSKVISSLAEMAESDAMAGFVIGKVYYYNAPNVFQTVGKRYDPVLWNGGHIGNREEDEGQYDTVEERAWCDDIYWLVKREVWEKTGGYDTEFAFQGEDFDWQVRAKNLGYKIMYTPHAKLWHKESMTIGRTSVFKAYYDARNPLIVHMKHRQKREYIPIILMRFKGNIKSSPKLILKGRFKYLYKVWQGFFSALLWGVRNKKLL